MDFEKKAFPETGAQVNLSALSRSSHSIGRLVKALCRVRLEIDGVPVNGWNEAHQYRYRKAEDLYDVAGALLAQHGVIVVSRVLSSRINSWFPAPSGARQLVTRVEVEITLMHESGEWLAIPYIGYAVDDGEKGAYKAYTGCLKHALLQLLMIGSEEGSSQKQRPGPSKKISPAEEDKKRRKKSKNLSLEKSQGEKQEAMVKDLLAEGFVQVGDREDLKGHSFLISEGKILSLSTKKAFLLRHGFRWDVPLRALVLE